MNKLTLGISLLSLCLLMFSGCGSWEQNEKGAALVNNPTEGARQNASLPPQPAEAADFLNSGIFRDNPKALKAWEQFIRNGKFREANGNDFKFSEAAQIELKGMFEEGWYGRINHPAITGNIDREVGFKDLAVIVVDTTRSDPARFGLVIFNVPEGDDTKPTAHWLFEHRDLSSALLSWHSNWPVVVFYYEDGSSDPYYINWDRTQRKYSVDKVQKGPDARSNNRLRDRGQ